MESIVFLDRSTVAAPLRPPTFEHLWKDYDTTLPDQVVSRLASATIAVTNKVALRTADLEKLKALKFIAVTATGFDNIDVAWCREHGIGVANSPAYAEISVAEHVMMLMLALRRNLPGFLTAVGGGGWQKSPSPNLAAYPVEDLTDTTLGLIGYGRIAQAVEKRAKAFGMSVLIADRKGASTVRPGRIAFETVLEKADVLSLHMPLNDTSRGLIGAVELDRMKKTAVLINTARGGIVDETALANALRSGQLGGAGVDVLSQEPPRLGNPLLDLKLPNLIVTPHIAWMSRQAQSRLAEDVLLTIEAFVKGERRNRIV